MVRAALVDMHCAIDQGFSKSSIGASDGGLPYAERLDFLRVCVGAGTVGAGNVQPR